MKQPYFSVGEEVIFQSIDGQYSAYNGEYIVVEIVSPKSCWYDRVMKNERINASQEVYGYLLNKNFPCNMYPIGEGLISEKCLFKKHKPSSESFEQMMNNLKKQNVNS